MRDWRGIIVIIGAPIGWPPDTDRIRIGARIIGDGPSSGRLLGGSAGRVRGCRADCRRGSEARNRFRSSQKPVPR
jgi:hypothetical protein